MRARSPRAQARHGGLHQEADDQRSDGNFRPDIQEDAQRAISEPELPQQAERAQERHVRRGLLLETLAAQPHQCREH